MEISGAFEGVSSGFMYFRGICGGFKRVFRDISKIISLSLRRVLETDLWD